MLKQKTKKWLSRLGAGMLLGLSIFSLGSSFGQNNASVPKGAGNFRRKEETDVNPELKNIVKTVQEEAELAISEQKNVFQNVQEEQSSFGQMALRFGVVTVWLASLGVVFSSLIFNVPFSLGRAALSVLPGNAHTAVLQLTVDRAEVFPNDKFVLNLQLNSDQPISSAKVFFKYPRETFFLEGIKSEYSPRVDFVEEGMEVVFADLAGKEFSWQDSLAEMSFFVQEISYGETEEPGRLEIIWDKSLVLSDEEGALAKNILGKVVNPRFSLLTDRMAGIFCQSSSVEPVGENFWREWMVGSPAASDGKKWNDLGNDLNLGCVIGNQTVGLFLSSLQPMENIVQESISGVKVAVPITARWAEGELFFYSVEQNKSQWEATQASFKLIFSGPQGELSWPSKDWGKVF